MITIVADHEINSSLMYLLFHKLKDKYDIQTNFRQEMQMSHIV